MGGGINVEKKHPPELGQDRLLRCTTSKASQVIYKKTGVTMLARSKFPDSLLGIPDTLIGLNKEAHFGAFVGQII